MGNFTFGLADEDGDFNMEPLRLLVLLLDMEAIVIESVRLLILVNPVASVMSSDKKHAACFFRSISPLLGLLEYAMLSSSCNCIGDNGDIGLVSGIRLRIDEQFLLSLVPYSSAVIYTATKVRSAMFYRPLVVLVRNVLMQVRPNNSYNKFEGLLLHAIGCEGRLCRNSISF